MRDLLASTQPCLRVILPHAGATRRRAASRRRSCCRAGGGGCCGGHRRPRRRRQQGRRGHRRGEGAVEARTPSPPSHRSPPRRSSRRLPPPSPDTLRPAAVAPARPIVKQLENIEPLPAGEAPEGTYDAFNKKYAYKGPSQTAQFLEVMSFGCGGPPQRRPLPAPPPPALLSPRAERVPTASPQGLGAGGGEWPRGDARGGGAPRWGAPGEGDALAASARLGSRGNRTACSAQCPSAPPSGRAACVTAAAPIRAVSAQLDRADQHPLTELAVAGVIVSSLIPLLKARPCARRRCPSGPA